MNVYIVVSSYDWQGGENIRGVFGSRHKATTYIYDKGGVLNEEYLTKLGIEHWDVDGEEYEIVEEVVT